jgi:7-keto-8-aminopelargonate synthetase-like enzyme
VPEKSARLRFFLSSEHSEAQLAETIAALAKLWPGA